MPITLPNWAQHETKSYGVPENIIKEALEGYKMSRMPKQIQQEERQRDLAARLTNAKANTEERYGGLKSLTGVASQVASLEMLKEQVGEDSPIYQRALNSFEQDQEHTAETIKSSQFYRNNDWRLFDPTSKKLHAESMASQGKFPGGKPGYETPEQVENAVDIFERERFQKNPTFLQQSALGAAQIDETIKLIDPVKAFQFSGIKGKAELYKERYNAERTGKPSQKLLEYEEQQTYLHNMAKQVRTFLKDSISPGAQEDLKYLVNPENLRNHPDVAKRKFESVVRDYEREKEKLERATKTGNPLGARPTFEPQTPIAEAMKKQSETTPGGSTAMVRVRNPKTRKIHPVPINEVDRYLAAGGQLVP